MVVAVDGGIDRLLLEANPYPFLEDRSLLEDNPLLEDNKLLKVEPLLMDAVLDILPLSTLLLVASLVVVALLLWVRPGVAVLWELVAIEPDALSSLRCIFAGGDLSPRAVPR